MAEYKVKVELPSDIKQFFETVNGQACIDFNVGSPHLTMTFEAEDEWELATMVTEVRDEVRANSYLDFHIDRPTLVTDQPDNK